MPNVKGAAYLISCHSKPFVDIENSIQQYIISIQMSSLEFSSKIQQCFMYCMSISGPFRKISITRDVFFMQKFKKAQIGLNIISDKLCDLVGWVAGRVTGI